MYSSVESLADFLAPATEIAGNWLGDSWDETPAFVAFFGVVFVAALLFWSLVVRLPLRKASLLSSCTISSVHGAVVSAAGFQVLQEWKPFDMDIPNTKKQTLLVEFSFGYMLADFFFYLIPFTPTDYMFIVHHFISSFYIVGVLKHAHSAISCVMMFFLGEVTSPLLNIFTMSRELRHTNKAAYKIFQLSSPLFTVCYILVRSILAPPVVGWIIYSVLFRCVTTPLAWRVPMSACLTMGITGSQLWTLKLLQGYMRQKSRAKAKAI